MRRLLLGSAVLFIAACGGGLRPEAPAGQQNPAVRNSIPTDPGTAVFIQGLVSQYGEDAVDSCLAAWQDEAVDPSDAHNPTDKPAQGFREFVVDCLGGSASASGDGGGGIKASMPSQRSSEVR